MQLFALIFLLPLVHGFHVHEWGTYTSCQGSNGKPLAGLHHGEVKDLPDFVHSRANGYTHKMWAEAKKKLMQRDEKRGIVPPSLKADTPEGCGFCEVMDWIPVAGTPTEVTQKLETPVIYFYSESQLDTVNVAVDFPNGIVTEVYPQTSVNIPPIGRVGATANGHAEWNVKVQPQGKSLSIPAVESTNIWAPSRRVNSNYLSGSASGQVENEKHIFYRGLGAFTGPVKITSTDKEIQIENLSDEQIPAVWVLSSDGSKGMIRSLPAIQPRGRISTPLHKGKIDLSNTTEAMDMELYLLNAGVQLEMSLVSAGLYPLEAKAMVDTWSTNYFRTWGTRVLYIAPESYPETLLPLSISPAPESTKRVLVGRVEVILAAEEAEFQPIAVRLVENTYSYPSQVDLKKSDYAAVHQLGRFAEAKMRRVLPKSINQQLLDDFVLQELTYDQ